MATKTTMAKWVKDYLELGIQSDNPSTRRLPAAVLRPLAAWWDDTRQHPRKVTGEDLVRFFLRDAPFANGRVENRTFNTYRASVRAFFWWCMRTKRMDTDLSVLDAVDRRSVVERDFIKLNRTKLAEMIEGCEDPRDKAMLAAGVYNCTRMSEIRRLRVGDVDFSEGQIHWFNVKKSRPIVRPILRQLDGPLRAWLGLYLGGGIRVLGAPKDTNEWRVFPTRTAPGGLGNVTYYPGVPVSAGASELIKRYTEPYMGKSKGEGAMHSLRRAGLAAIIATLIDDGVDPATARIVAQVMADHADPKTTDRYTGDSAQKMLMRSVLKDRDILPDLSTVARLRKYRDGQATAL